MIQDVQYVAFMCENMELFQSSLVSPVERLDKHVTVRVHVSTELSNKLFPVASRCYDNLQWLWKK